MPIKKEKKTEFTAPVLDLKMAEIRIIEGTLQEEPTEVTTQSGETFISKPHYNAKMEVVDDFGDGSFDGTIFYDRFYLKQKKQRSTINNGKIGPEPASDGPWVIKGGTKLGYLAEARYGDDFFEDNNDQEFDEEDFIDFRFRATIEPRKNRSTGAVTGTTVSYKTIHAVPVPKKRPKNTAAPQKNSGKIDDELDLSPEELTQINEALG
jgi:hypothetical protein